MRAIIIAGGTPPRGQSGRPWPQTGDLIIGANGGASQALAWDLVPDLVIGDMDSLPDQTRATLEQHGCRFVRHPRAKDETDLELALTYAVECGAQEIMILGALGGRLDHTLANILLLALPALDGIPTCIVDGDQTALLLRSGEKTRLDGVPGDLVSLLPLGGEVQGVTTSGLTWELHGDTLRFGFSRGVSNEMTAPTAFITVVRGYLLVVHGRRTEGQEGR